MSTSFEHTIRELHGKVDLVDLIGRHVGLRRAGKQFKGLCPFHGEKSPSFYVDPNRHRFHCFGCNERGDAIDFVQKVEGVSFQEAIRVLGARYGVTLPKQSPQQADQAAKREQQRDVGYRLTRLATEVYQALLAKDPLGEAGRAYQAQRKISAETAETMRIGYAPHPTEAGWDTLVRAISDAKLPMSLAEELGLVARSERTGNFYDRFRGRLMFPIIGAGGSVLAFSGRVLPSFENEGETKAPKYINSPESFLYKKSKTLYGLHRAGRAMTERRRAVLVEGNVDVVALHQRGHIETVAPLGTALTETQCDILRRYTEQVVLCFDGDRAGAKAIRKAIPLLLTAGLEVRVASLEPGEDPDSADPDRLDGLLARPMPGLEWRMREMVAAGATESIDSKGRALRALLPLLRLVKGRDMRGDYATLAADLLQLPIQRIWATVEGNRPPPGFDSATPVHSPAMRPQAPLPRGQLDLAALLVDRPELARVAERAGIFSQVTDPRLAPIVRRVIDAAVAGEPKPGEGELLQLVEADAHPLLHRRLFAGEFLETDDPQAVLDHGLLECDIDQIDRENETLDQHVAEARRRGLPDEVQRLIVQKIERSKRKSELSTELAKLRRLH